MRYFFEKQPDNPETHGYRTTDRMYDAHDQLIVFMLAFIFMGCCFLRNQHKKYFPIDDIDIEDDEQASDQKEAAPEVSL